MRKNSHLWNKSTTTLLTLLVGSKGNLLLHGSVPVEENHSSVAAHLGAGASWSVVKQVQKLLSRNLHLTSKRQHKDSQAFVASVNYKSHLQDQDAFDDKASKKNCPNMDTTSCSLLSTKQVAVSSLLSMKMIL
jgi:hypothetical protein